MNKIELLLPAKDVQSGKVALDHGADAVYIGAPRFGARQAAGNSVRDLQELVQYAHLYGAKVFVTLNTLLFDDELEDARQLIYQLYHIGVDALIIQDLGILKMDLPPIRLHASTQCHNNSVERVRFMQSVGMKRVVLARELDVETIRLIRSKCEIELEAFVHGALCVCYSGQCYMSKMTTGRSGNRGECAQVCRTAFDLVDAHGKTLLNNKHLLSLRDMNRAPFLRDLLSAGVTSLKVEGRLKDENYVKNITTYYRQLLDDLMEHDDAYCRASSGKTSFFFRPDPQRTFNRGFTAYFVNGRREPIACFDTPKAMGKFIGQLFRDRQGHLFYEGEETIANGDGLCFFNENDVLEGFSVNRMEGKRILPHKPLSDFKQVDVYRNVDRQFEKALSEKTSDRRIAVDAKFSQDENGFVLHLCDEDGCEAVVCAESPKIAANSTETAARQQRNSLSKLGNTPFVIRNLVLDNVPYFLQASFLNKMRNDGVERLKSARISHFRPKETPLNCDCEPLFESVDYKRNIINELHKSLYADFGATKFEYGIDKTLDFSGKELMVCKYCLRFELGLCSKQGYGSNLNYPLFLKDKNHRYRLEFDCVQCQMKIWSC